MLAKPVVTFLVASPLWLYVFLWPPMPEVFRTPAPGKWGLYQASESPSETGLSPFLDVPDTSPSIETPPPEAPPLWRQIDHCGLASPSGHWRHPCWVCACCWAAPMLPFCGARPRRNGKAP
ncbi:MAG TPA: hypothetical protein PLO37_05375 [Candidatus Hydrogenedentes bacterium]|nr:hypothetical protein [Candidatus Hydrogenedentota bacterium]HPG66257.1 hypothetical protein [Candidatus Hydrogenedentota bacterium]